MTNSPPAHPFKACSCCASVWPSRDEFMRDPDVILIGYQVNFGDLELGFFMFHHNACGTSFGLQAGQFTDLYHGPVFDERRTGESDCPEYCLRIEELRPCPVRCECAYVREILQILRR